MSFNFKLIKIWIKEFLKRCPHKIQFTKDDPPFLIIGHRGAPYKEPENTISSFEFALKEGANALEIDLSLTKDNYVILWHDWDPNAPKAVLREAGFEPFVRYKPHPPPLTSSYRKVINQITLKEIRDHFDYKKRKGKIHLVARAHIPTLDEFFEWAKDKKQLKYVFFDNKAPDAEKGCAVSIIGRLKDLQKEYQPEFKIVIETAYEECFTEMKKTYPDFLYGLDIESAAGFVFEPEDYSAVNSALINNNCFAIGMRPRKITFANWTTYRRIMQYDVNKLRDERENGNGDIRLIAATVSKRKELRCLVRLGVDGIQTDFPARLKKIAGHYRRRVE